MDYELVFKTISEEMKKYEIKQKPMTAEEIRTDKII